MVIATVLLSVIGMSAGLVLGSRHESLRQAGDQANGVPTEPGTSPVSCPDEMHATARRVGYPLPMTQVLRVRAAANRTTVWICTNAAGKLFYQANRGDDGTWIEGKTALFLSNVVEFEDGYRATAADGNTFFVNTERLEVVRRGKPDTVAVEPE